MPRGKGKAGGGRKEGGVRRAAKTKSTKKATVAISQSDLTTNDGHPSHRRLEDLPDEILMNILGNFEVIDTFDSDKPEASIEIRRALCSLAQCSKRFDKIVTPILYQTFIQTKRQALPLFVQQLLRKPELRKYVKNVVGTASYKDDMLVTVFTENDQDLCTEVIMKFACDGRVLDWAEAIDEGQWEPLFALIFYLAPNMEKLKLQNVVRIHPENHIGMMFMMADRNNKYDKPTTDEGGTDEAGASESYLNHLKSVALTPARASTKCFFTIDLTTVSIFLSHKPVEEIRVDRFALLAAQSENIFDVDVVHLRQNSIKTLIFDHVNLEENCLVPFFAAFRCLERLEFHDAGDLKVLEDFNPTKFESAIAHLKPTLRSLTLRHASRSQRETYDNIFLKSLNEFETLEEIDVNSDLLLGGSAGWEEWFSKVTELPLVTGLPATLKVLTISDADPAMAPHLVELVKHKKDVFPKLTAVHAHFLEWSDYIMERAGELETACEEEDVACCMQETCAVVSRGL